ncbi:NFkB inhibitor [Yokapox virus]|uniref:Early protein OPG038 n=1 Tax=Yokapox virus TaxID=1076255 RepID=G3EI62_9POXV|nr:NFkB inhibitor [Yokapox virus]AEN03759.1 NFkB inhibitor [Yokapox virus]
MNKNILPLLMCILSVCYCVETSYKPLQCQVRDPRYWYLAAELTIGLNYNITSTIQGECHMEYNYIDRNARITLTGYGLRITMDIINTDQRFVGAAEGIGENNKLSVLLFTTEKLYKISHNISLTITCLEYNCGNTWYKNNKLSEAIHHRSVCDITINGSCVRCVSIFMDPLNTHSFYYQGKYITNNYEYNQRGTYGVAFGDDTIACLTNIDKIRYDICYRQ